MQRLTLIQNINTYYYTNDRNFCKIDFIVDNGENVIPIEVQAEENLRAKSLKAFIGKPAVVKTFTKVKHCCVSKAFLYFLV